MLPTECTPGTEVTYWPVRKEDGTFDGLPLETTITTEAWQPWAGSPHSNGTWVCCIEGKSGYVNVTHLEKRNAD